MKKLLLCLAATTALTAVASGNLDIRGTMFTVDTVFHAKVGPGTTQTQLRLIGGQPLDVFYLTVDKSTPGVSIRTVCATDKLAGTARTSSMAQSKSKDGLFYFAGTNGDFFSTSGNASNGSSKIGTPTTSCIVDGEIYKTSNSNYQFSVDRDGVARVCRFNYYTGTATIGDKVTLFKGVNVMSPNNGITLYTPKFWGTANQNEYADNCNQVTAKLVEGDKFEAGGRFRLEVTSEPTTDGDTPIPTNGFVIHGRGTSKTGCNTGAKAFVGALKPGDIVEFNNIILTPEGEAIHPLNVVSGNPKNVGNGETLDTEGERGDASARHPRTSIGVSKDGNKIIMMVIDGRSGTSAGVTTSMLADVMRYAGAYEAVNLDGGGSSTLYTAALGVRNHTSDGNERAVGNAIFAVLEAPEDTEVAEINFVDWAKNVPVLGQYRPKIYAYNKYGKLINTDYTDFTLSCEPSLGDITADGKALIAATNAGTFALTATAPNGAKTVIPVTVVDGVAVQATIPDVLLNATRQWPVQLHSVVDGDALEVSPSAFNWQSTDASVASITEDGIAQGIADGTCSFIGTRSNQSVTVNATVQVPKDIYHHLETQPNTENWSIAKISCVTAFTANADHSYNIDFKQTSTRGPKITLQNKISMWSHPEALSIEIDPGTTPITTLTADMVANNADRNVKIDRTYQAGTSEYIFPISEAIDTDNLAVYPIEFRSLAIVPAGKTSINYHIDIKNIRTKYNESTVDDVLDLRNEKHQACPFRLDGDRTIRFNQTASSATLVDLAGRIVADTDNADTITSPDHGVYIITATIGDTTHTAKIAL